MSNNFRTGNIDTRDLFADDLTEDTNNAEEKSEAISDHNEPDASAPLLDEPVNDPQNIIDELDSLRYVLNEGHEFQQDIPLLEDIEIIPEGITQSISITTPADIDVPILTDTCDTYEVELPPQDAAASQQTSLADIAQANIDELLDQLLAEYLPILEKKLRTELDQKIRAIINTGKPLRPTPDIPSSSDETSID